MAGLEWIAALVGAALAGGFLVGFLGRSKAAPVALGLAIALHVLLPWWLPTPTRAPRREPPPRMTEVSIRAPEPSPPRVDPPPSTVEPAPTPAPSEPAPTPTRRPKAKAPAKPATTEPAPTPQRPAAAPLRFDLGQLNTSATSGISVAVGTPGGMPGGTGTAKSGPRTAGSGHGASTVPDASPGAAKGPSWAPLGAAAVARLPQTRSIPKKPCPATAQGVQGTVVLAVQVRRDGTVRRATVRSGIGHGCDEIAAAALRAARFEPATDGAGAPVDFELDYEYAFRLEN